jgi:hypothetical protein
MIPFTHRSVELRAKPGEQVSRVAEHGVTADSPPSRSLGPLVELARLAAERPTVRHRKMKNAGILFELIQRLDEFEDNDRLHPLVIYAQNGADAGRKSPALICQRSEGGSLTCPLDPSLSEVLSVEKARDAIEVWSAWRGGLAPSPEDRFRTVMFFSQHGAYFPLETDREGM